MDQLSSEVEVPSTLSLDQLCTGVLHELRVRGYSRRTVNRYNLVWRHFAEFAREQNLGNAYSRSLAMRFEETYGLCEGRRLKPTERWRRHLVFVLRILDILGGFSNKAIRNPSVVIDQSRTLHIKGLAMFGGGEVKTYL